MELLSSRPRELVLNTRPSAKSRKLLLKKIVGAGLVQLVSTWIKPNNTVTSRKVLASRLQKAQPRYTLQALALLAPSLGQLQGENRQSTRLSRVEGTTPAAASYSRTQKSLATILAKFSEVRKIFLLNCNLFRTSGIK